MRRSFSRLRLTVAALVGVGLTVAVTAAVAGPTASINVAFSNDGRTATIISSKDISNFTVTICTGTLAKVEAVNDNLGTSETIGPFTSDIVSVRVKSGTTDLVFQNPFDDCTHGGDHNGDGDHDGDDHHANDHGGNDTDGDGDHDFNDHS